MKVLQDKYIKLQKILSELESVVVAFSGGVDSTLLLKVAIDVLGSDKVIAVTTDSESYPSSELVLAKQTAKKIGAKHIVIETSELAIPGYKENTKNRCYFCKKGLFEELAPIQLKHGFKHIVFGLIADDTNDYRPGVKAAKEHGVRAPLQEAGLFKGEIRELSKQLELETWDKPSSACLSSRIAYGEEITVKKLTRVEQSEEYLKRLGFRQVRVRTHGDIARIEVEPDKLSKIVEMHQEIASKLHSFGFDYVTADLEGFRSGSMNKLLQR
ncbi:ATP-dependent sacrificial sulfur transferase LarE [Tepidibacillus infernus]|uniref:ATP-dependent sacrificial sulfur transferase LarE n=1 Tax=Tepidibacillus infernus TaxID=1806172 RepID=UPI003A27E5A0